MIGIADQRDDEVQQQDGQQHHPPGFRGKKVFGPVPDPEGGQKSAGQGEQVRDQERGVAGEHVFVFCQFFSLFRFLSSFDRIFGGDGCPADSIQCRV